MVSRRLPKTSRISPTDSVKNKSIEKEFEIIEKFFWITGIVFNRSKIVCSVYIFFLIMFDILFSLLNIYFIVANFYMAATSSMHSPGYRFINAFANCSSLCVRFVIIFKRRHIRKCIEIISRLGEETLPLKELRSKTRYIFVCCTSAVLLPLAQMIFGIIANNVSNSYNKYETLYFFGMAPPKNSKLWIHGVAIIVRIMHILFCRSLPLLAVILCTFVFSWLKDINKNFLTRLKDNIDRSSSTKLFSDFTTFYRRITKISEQAEKSLSLISFLLYGYILSCTFSVTSFLVTNHGGTDVTAVIYQLITLVEIVVCFIILSMRAANVNESAVEVKNIIHTLPSKQIDYNPSLTATLLQLANNFGSEICMTGWGLFIINRSFILTTVGVVVSYGVILFQIGK